MTARACSGGWGLEGGCVLEAGGWRLEKECRAEVPGATLNLGRAGTVLEAGG